jgi:hypothetical protein
MATEPSHPDTGLISRTENITHPRDYQFERLPEIAAVPAALTNRGSTLHFTVSYDNSLIDGPTIADAVLAACEKDYSTLQRDFGGITPGNLPFNINILPGDFGASHATCAATTLSIGAQSAPGVNIPFMLSLVVAEEDEVFEAAIGRGWNCGAGNGEGLSRVLANDMYPGAEPSDFVSAPVWLDGGRPDFVNNTDPTDQNYLSIGCSVLFLNWLHYQLNFSWNQIILAGAPTLAQTYTKLTGRIDAWTRFTILLRSHFPAGKPSGLTTDNPFPLTLPPQFAQNTPIAALTRNPNQMDLFAVGLDGGVYSAWWGFNQWHDWFSVI